MYERGELMFDGIKRKAKLFLRMGNGDYKEFAKPPSIEFNSTIESDGEQEIRPPTGEEMTLTVDIPPKSAKVLSRAFHVECFGRLPYRKDGCNHCNIVNDCIKAKIANNFNRR